MAAAASHPRTPGGLSGSRRIRRADRSAGGRSRSWLMDREPLILFRYRVSRGAALREVSQKPLALSRPGSIIRVMPWGNVLLAAVISVLAAPSPAPNATVTLYKVELANGESVWARDTPRDNGASVLFHRQPGGLLVSLKKADVKRVTASRFAPEVARGPRPGATLILLGPTGAGWATGKTDTGAGPTLPGENKDGTALLNPDRQFR